MRSSVIITALVLVFVPQCLAHKKEELIFDLSQEFMGQWLITRSVQFLKRPCTLAVFPKFTNWRLYYESSFTCPGWSDIKGTALTRCKLRTGEKAMQTFLAQAIEKRLFRRVDARNWLEQRSTVHERQANATLKNRVVER
ncbi:anti-lipopolysaccharide factor-like [Penaeus vannamei]|uniref:anti-lipopolysaccharide factor-like n=1 Tax=Penaeus vannamei TaxID=6689 RepID=UPI00387F6C0C